MGVEFKAMCVLDGDQKVYLIKLLRSS